MNGSKGREVVPVIETSKWGSALDQGAHNTGYSVRNAEGEAEGMSHVRKGVVEMSSGVEQDSEKLHVWC